MSCLNMCQNGRQRLEVREDGAGEVVIAGLEDVPVSSAVDLLAAIDDGNRNRTTHATGSMCDICLM